MNDKTKDVGVLIRQFYDLVQIKYCNCRDYYIFRVFLNLKIVNNMSHVLQERDNLLLVQGTIFDK